MTRTPLAACLAALVLAAPAAGQTPAITNVLVMPFDNVKAEGRVFWLSEGAAVLLTEQLQRHGASSVPRGARVRAFDRLQLPSAAALSHATVIKVGQFVGASSVVIGAYETAGDEIVVRARVIRLDAGRAEPETVQRGPVRDLIAVFRRVARALTGMDEPVLPNAAPVWSSPQTFELYVKGLLAETPATALGYLDQALEGSPADPRIMLAQWEVHTEQDDHAAALAAVNGVAAGNPLAREARFKGALSLIALERWDEAFATLKALESEARAAAVSNALGIVQLRRGGALPQTGGPTYFFNQAAQLDPARGDYFFNLGYAYWLAKDAPAAIYWMREAVRRDPTDGDAHFVLAEALKQAGADAEATRERELAIRLSSSYESWEDVPAGLERLETEVERQGVRVDEVLASSGQRDQAELAAFHLEAAERAFEREADREAERQLRRAIFLSPYLAEAHLLMGQLHLRAGRPADAVEALKIALWSEETVEAHLALAEAYLRQQDVDAARAEVDRALQLDPDSAEAQALRARVGPPPRR